MILLNDLYTLVCIIPHSCILYSLSRFPFEENKPLKQSNKVSTEGKLSNVFGFHQVLFGIHSVLTRRPSDRRLLRYRLPKNISRARALKSPRKKEV